MPLKGHIEMIHKLTWTLEIHYLVKGWVIVEVRKVDQSLPTD